MECSRLDKIDEQGVKHYTPKKPYDTLDEAIAQAKIYNRYNNTKLVAYKCKTCFKYHIGRNGKIITDKERNKLIQHNSTRFNKNTTKELTFEEGLQNVKIVGFIDLTNIK
jgi:hypothetical protein